MVAMIVHKVPKPPRSTGEQEYGSGRGPCAGAGRSMDPRVRAAFARMKSVRRTRRKLNGAKRLLRISSEMLAATKGRLLDCRARGRQTGSSDPRYERDRRRATSAF